jgi:hypothetical protein
MVIKGGKRNNKGTVNKLLECISLSKQLSLAHGFSRVIPVVAILHPFQRVQVAV